MDCIWNDTNVATGPFLCWGGPVFFAQGKPLLTYLPITGETLAGGHGDEFSINAHQISLAESWAEHAGQYLTKNDYGSNYIMQLENLKNECPNHIPIGLYFDLLDGANLNETVHDDNNSCQAGGIGPNETLVDNVLDFTNSQFFSLLKDVETPQEFINLLNIIYTPSSPNNVIDVNDLFNEY